MGSIGSDEANNWGMDDSIDVDAVRSLDQHAREPTGGMFDPYPCDTVHNHVAPVIPKATPDTLTVLRKKRFVPALCSEHRSNSVRK